MSFQTLKLSGSSMLGIQEGINSTSHDIANINTIAYKKKVVNFESVIGGSALSGTELSSRTVDFNQGQIKETGLATNVALQGNGFFTVQNGAGDVVFTRAGNFSVDSQANLVDPNGNYILGTGAARITLPSDLETMQINSLGEIIVKRSGVEEFEFLDQIQLATFTNPNGLISVGQNLYKPSAEAGTVNFSAAGSSGTATQATKVIAGAIEGSNVNLSTSLVDLMAMQRSYQAVSRVTSTASDLLDITIGLSA